MISYSGNSDSVIIVLHEIYGINKHMQQVCGYYNLAGLDVICPDLLNLSQPFDYAHQEDAYEYFMKNVGFNQAYQQAKGLMLQVRLKYKHVFILGFSIGATIAWMGSEGDISCDGIIGYYGSRIRDFLYITPKYKTLLIFPDKESSFNVNNLVCTLKEKVNVNACMLSGSHGFSDQFSPNYNEESNREAQKIVNDFIKQRGEE